MLLLLMLQKRVLTQFELVGGGEDSCRLQLVGDDLTLGGKMLELLGQTIDIDAVVVVLLHWLLSLMFC